MKFFPTTIKKELEDRKPMLHIDQNPDPRVIYYPPGTRDEDCVGIAPVELTIRCSK